MPAHASAKIPHFFVCGIATEVNTFSPIFIDTTDFANALLARPNQHPHTPTLCTAPLIHARKLAQQGKITLTEGTTCWADPAGLVNKQTFESLRDEILQQLISARQKSPIQAVILCLHGAMVADGYLDPEGDMIARIRKIVGDKVIISAGIDPHSHLTKKRVKHSNILIAFKEFPHTDFSDRGREVVHTAYDAAIGKIRPVISVFDCKMIDIFPTNHPKMRDFIHTMYALENDTTNKVLCVSLIHGFMAGDVPEMGTKICVVTDNDKQNGDKIACKLGHIVFAMRGQIAPVQQDEIKAVALALQKSKTADKPIVIADMWDNPGGGVAGDATVILKHILHTDTTTTKIAFATIWDPIAVQLCTVAGVGAKVPLRFGAKSAPKCGEPVDGVVTVKNIVKNATQTFCDSIVNMGDSVLIEIQGIQVILNSVRVQVFERTVFTTLGVDPMAQDILVVKSTNHFYEDFSKLADTILYCDAGNPYPNKPAITAYVNAPTHIWPMVKNPHNTEE